MKPVTPRGKLQRLGGQHRRCDWPTNTGGWAHELSGNLESLNWRRWYGGRPRSPSSSYRLEGSPAMDCGNWLTRTLVLSLCCWGLTNCSAGEELQGRGVDGRAAAARCGRRLGAAVELAADPRRHSLPSGREELAWRGSRNGRVGPHPASRPSSRRGTVAATNSRNVTPVSHGTGSGAHASGRQVSHTGNDKVREPVAQVAINQVHVDCFNGDPFPSAKKCKSCHPGHYRGVVGLAARVRSAQPGLQRHVQ